MTDCTCPKPTRPTEYADPSICTACTGFACPYAEVGRTRCPSWRCDCFIEAYPDSPMDLHPEDFIVGTPVPSDVVAKVLADAADAMQDDLQISEFDGAVLWLKSRAEQYIRDGKRGSSGF